MTFVECGSAAVFYSTAVQHGLLLRSCRLRIGWAKEEPTISPSLLQAIHSGTTRNVYIGGIKDFELFTEQKLRTDFAPFGEVEMVNFLKEKGAAFVNLQVPLRQLLKRRMSRLNFVFPFSTSISAAQKAIDQIATTNQDYHGLNLRPGRDRCNNAPREMYTG